MPLPKPNKGEKQPEFIGRCMGNDVMKKDFTDNKQRQAVCFSQWRKDKAQAIDMSAVRAMNAYEILIYGQIGESFLEQGITAKGVVDQIKLAGAAPINLRIHSVGGNLFEGYTIYNALLAHEPGVTVHVDGIAASIAAYIAMAGNPIVMAENSMLMIHNPTIELGQVDHKELATRAKLLEEVTKSYANAFVRRSQLTAAEVAEMMDDETWLTADQALLLGLIDDVAPELAIAASVDLSKFKHVPKVARLLFDKPQASMEHKISANAETTTETPQPEPAPQPAPEPAPEPAPAAADATLIEKLKSLLQPKTELLAEIGTLRSQIEVRDASLVVLNNHIENLNSQIKVYKQQVAEIPAIRELVANLEKEKKDVSAMTADQLAALGFPQKELPAAVSDTSKSGQPNAAELLKRLNAAKDPQEFTRLYKEMEKDIKAAMIAGQVK